MPKHHGSSRDLRGPTAKSPGCCGGVASVAWDAPGGGISHWMSLTDPKDPKGPVLGETVVKVLVVPIFLATL